MATAVLNRDGTIVSANRLFRRLFGITTSRHPRLRVEDIVSDAHRPAVRHALDEQGSVERSTVRVTRYKTPSMWIAMEISRLGPESYPSYLMCAQPMFKRRRLDALPDSPGGPRRLGVSATAGVAAPAWPAAVPGSESWPPLLTTLSHELRSSLNVIRGWVAMAENGSVPPAKMPRALGIIRRNAESLSGLVETLFDLSKKSAGSLALKLEVLNLNELAELVVESTYPEAKRHDVTLTVGCSRSALFVNGDRMRLEQVVRNLVDNAIKFTPGGGKVNLRTVCHRPFGELVVDDTGAGISPELLPAIFDPFRQGVSDVQPSDVGVGLGLALVRELVQLHHGEVHAISRGKGRGSRFTVKLPLAHPSPVAMARRA